MSADLDALKSQALALTSAERADLAAFLLANDDQPADDELAWNAEIARRVAEIRSGAVTGRPLDEVLARLSERPR